MPTITAPIERPKRVRRNISALSTTLDAIDQEAARLGWTPSQVIDSLARQCLPNATQIAANAGT